MHQLFFYKVPENNYEILLPTILAEIIISTGFPNPLESWVPLNGFYWGFTGIFIGLYGDDGKENESYTITGYILGLYRCHIL